MLDNASQSSSEADEVGDEIPHGPTSNFLPCSFRILSLISAVTLLVLWFGNKSFQREQSGRLMDMVSNVVSNVANNVVKMVYKPTTRTCLMSKGGEWGIGVGWTESILHPVSISEPQANCLDVKDPHGIQCAFNTGSAWPACSSPIKDGYDGFITVEEKDFTS